MKPIRHLLIGAACLCLAALTLQAQTKRPITHEDVWLMKRVGAPVPSPDGKWVVFTVTEPTYDEKDQVTDLWIVPADGSEPPRRLTNTKGAESGATWTPDSASVVFAARREGDEVNQLYLLNVTQGGEAQRLTSLSTGARAPQVSPDGKHVLFQSSVYPGALNDEDNKRIAAERKARKWNARVYETFPIRNWDRWIDEKQTHVFVQALDANANAKDLLAGTYIVSQKGFAGATTSGGDDLQAVWTPESDAIIFTAMDNRHRSAYAETHTGLYQVFLKGGKLWHLSPDGINEGGTTYTVSASRPRFSPDGQTLYCITELMGGKTYNLERLARITWPLRSASDPPDGSERKNVDFKVITLGFDRSIASFDLDPNSQAIYVTAEVAGHENLYRLSGGNPGNAELLIELNEGVYSPFQPNRATHSCCWRIGKAQPVRWK
jgi:dipeptidyl aminopeptidase/acylaminoacyl peptidase